MTFEGVMADDVIDIKGFIHDSIEAMLNCVTTEGVHDPYDAVAAIVTKKHNITPDIFRQVHHPFHWYLVNEKKIITMEMPSGPDDSKGYLYKRGVMAPNLDELTQGMFDEYAPLIESRMKALMRGA
jgi:hypothetical protein